jgi:predicted RNA-binding Zn-ribbon protein involved in translation (DUF1610 family)
MNASIAPEHDGRQGDPAHARVVATDRACNGCGFNLKGIPTSGLCPECGMHVARSLTSKLLRYASPEYVRTLHQGTVWLLIAIALNTLYSVAITVVEVAYNVWGAGGAGGGPAPAGMAWLTPVRSLTYMASVPIAGAMLWGVLLYTRQDPGESLTEQPRAARIVLRAITLVQLLLTIGSISTVLLTISPGVGTLVETISSLTYVATLVVQHVALCRYAKWLALRFPDEALAKRSRQYMWLLPLLNTVGCVVLLLGPIVALVLVWLFYNTMRKRLRDTLASMDANSPPDLPNNLA